MMYVNDAQLSVNETNFKFTAREMLVKPSYTNTE